MANDIDIDPGHRLVAPNLIRSQALTLLLQDVRNGHLTEEAALRLHERITELKMRLLGDRVSRRERRTDEELFRARKLCDTPSS